VNEPWTWLCLLVLGIQAGCAPRAPEHARNSAPYPPSTVIRSVSFDFTTHRRLAPGSDNWPLTWADDDHQYTSWGDGGGYRGTNRECRVSLGFGRVEGDPDAYRGIDVWGAPGCAPNPATFQGKSNSLLALNGRLYAWVHPGSDVRNLEWSRLYRSDDRGGTWEATGVEFTHAADSVGLLAFLQFGQGYQGARDGFVYVYATLLRTAVWEVQRPGELLLLRVPLDRIEDQAAYQYYAGLGPAGDPRWGPPEARRPAFRDPNGVMRNSAAYNAALGRYFLVTNHTARNQGNLALFEAPEPWGPWATVLYASGWPGNVADVPNNTFLAHFAPKWWSADGRGFVLVFTGKTANDSWNSVEGAFTVFAPDAVAPRARADSRTLFTTAARSKAAERR
jgi:hypothetical protein